jgi:hypothetical protein
MNLAALGGVFALGSVAFGALFTKLIGIGALVPAHEATLYPKVSGFRAPLPRVGDLTCWGDSIEAEIGISGDYPTFSTYFSCFFTSRLVGSWTTFPERWSV